MLPPTAAPGVEAGRRALLLSIGALALTFMVPVMGLALGVFAIVVCVRAWRTKARERQSIIMPIIGFLISIVSIFTAALVTWFQMYFSNEFNAYGECMKGAGTGTSQQACVTRLEQAMERRLPFIPKGSLRLPFAP
ncbi:hypothetical protein [Sphaerisporangium corydalis]|uniref:DUF4190 domain-containing protein n=1 Tax=Sphaerisporangium corydalis TaxID=1441875 RepID=A0ABV9EPZ0_9ACTN|nr:hypothetical protein [Sphaerisporangium corydalis]